MWWVLFVAEAVAGEADMNRALHEVLGHWALDPGRSDRVEDVLARQPPPPGPSAGGRSPGGPPGGMGGGPPDNGAAGGAAPRGMLQVELLRSGGSTLDLTPTEVGLSISWGSLAPVDLTLGGPTVKLHAPQGGVRARLLETPYGLMVQRRAEGVRQTETLFRQGDQLIVVVESKVPSKETVFLRRVYRRATPAAPPPG